MGTTFHEPASDSSKHWLYGIGWLAFSILGLYGYFTSAPRAGATDLFQSDPAAAVNRYFVGDPVQTFAELMMWVAAFYAGKVFVFPESRARYTMLAAGLAVLSLGIFTLAGK